MEDHASLWGQPLEETVAIETLPRRLSLARLIDLELQLARDRDAAPQELRRRDADIGQAIDATRLDPPAIYLQWLAALRKSTEGQQPTAGEQVQHWLELLGALLVVVGAIFGGSTVAGWLLARPAQPVNALAFWSVLVGVQILLLCVWLVAVIPVRKALRLPGIPAVQMIARGLGRLLPLLMGWIANRLAPRHRQLVEEVRSIVRQKEWLYGRVRFWLLVQFTQLFALAFNIAAVVTFIAISFGTDPAFGWKSTLLEPPHLHRAVGWVAAPWANWFPEAVPTQAEIEATRFTSLDVRFDVRTNDGNADFARWTVWWPFLLASLIAYGLLPRLFTWLIAAWRLRSAIRNVRLDTAELVRVRERLTSAPFDSRATKPESGEAARGAIPQAMAASSPTIDLGPAAVVRWAGVALDYEEVARLIHQRVRGEVLQIVDAGGLDPHSDEAALEAATQNTPQQVILLAEAFEPPVAEYTDFITRLRQRLGEGRTILVLLYDRSPEQPVRAARDQDLDLWRARLAAGGDPWLRVESLVTEESRVES